MNVVDLSGWLEYLANGPNAPFFAPAIRDTDHLLVPTICLYEVFKHLYLQRGEAAALEAAGVLPSGRIVDITAEVALYAAQLSIQYHLPVTDSLILAVARLNDATLWTQDEHSRDWKGSGISPDRLPVRSPFHTLKNNKRFTMSLLPGQQLAEFQIIQVLGRGAFGTIYLAQDTLLDRLVAIKELAFAAQSDEVAFKRFIQEARAAGGLNHPHIVTVYTLKVLDPNVYLVMEYLPGGSLRALLERRGPLPVEEAARIAADVCEGLAAAHAKGIVHRDIKPENILIAEDGRAKVGDFGIAHVPRHAGGTSLTHTGFQPGTLVYMSPEQIRGEPVDGRSDVYQVGAVLYEMLTGRHYIDLDALERRARETAGSNVMLFQARLFELLSDAICRRAPEDIRRIRPELPTWICQVLTTMLEKRPDRRPQAGAAALALRQGGAVSAVPTPAVGALQPGIVRSSCGMFKGRSTVPDPEQAERHFRQALDHYRQGRLEQAAREFQAALKVRPDYAEAHCGLGTVLYKQGRLEEAAREFRAALKICPDDARAHYNLGLVLWSQGLLAEAAQEFQATLKIRPDYAEAHNNLGIVFSNQGRLEEAVREFQAALKIRPDFVDARVNLGEVLRRLGRLEEAVREFRATLKIRPDYAEAHYNLGVTLFEQGQLEEAVREFRATLKIRPDYAEAHYNLGVALAQQGRLEEAAREFRAALKIRPDYAEAHYNLGVVLAQQGRLKEAVREFWATLNIRPDWAEAYYGLGVVFLEQDRLEEALQAWNLAASLGSESALSVLKRLNLS